jgi:hypothetical protein
LTSAPGVCEWSDSSSGRFTLRERTPWYPLDRRVSKPQSQPERNIEVKILDAAGARTPTPSVVQSVACRYTDY